MKDKRPDPDELLRRFKSEEKSRKRGRLKIFFGAYPGVGKTHAMLEAAQVKKNQGVDVVVGYLETLTAYLVSPAYRAIPALLLLVAVMYVRPRGLLGRR